MAIAAAKRVTATLAYRNFRFFWAGQALSVGGRQASTVAQSWLLYDITGSALQLGFLGLARAAPALVLGLVGGVVADRIDRRRLMIMTTVGAALIWGVLATLTLTDRVAVWHILGTTVLAGSISAFEGPSRHSLFPHLVDRRYLTNAIALNSAMDSVVRIFIPVVAGVLVDQVGTGHTGPAAALYFVTGLYITSSFMVSQIRVPRIVRSQGGGLQSLVEGLAYLRTNKLLRFMLIMAFTHAFFGMGYTGLLPIFADRISPESSGAALGLLFAAAGVGGLFGALVMGAVRSGERQGIVLIGAATLFGGGLVVFSLTPWLVPALGFLFLASLGQNVFAVVSQSAVQARVPDDYRGRVMGFWGMQFNAMHPLGILNSGALAAVVGASPAVAIGGTVLVAFALLLAGTNREIRELRDPHREPVAEA